MKMFKTYKKNKGKKTIKIIHVNENYYKQNSHDNKKIPLQLRGELRESQTSITDTI